MERWAAVPGYEGLYEVSDIGNVRRADSGRPIALVTFPNKRVHAFLSSNGERKSLRVHRLVISAFCGPIADGLEVNHKNGDPSDNRLENLEVVTHSENVMHRYYVLRQKVRRVTAICAETGVRHVFPSIKEARKSGFSYEAIIRSSKTGNPTRSGYYLSIE